MLLGRTITKRFFGALVCSLCLTASAFGQSANALFLNNGDKVIGYVMDLNQDPDGGVKIQTTDGKTMSFPMSEIDNIVWTYKLVEPSPGPIYRYGETFRWKYNNLELSDKNFSRYFDVDLYHEYIVGKNQFNIGGAGLTLGTGCLMLSILSIDPNTGSMNNSFYAYLGTAAILYCVGAVYTKKGIALLDKVERTFNERQANAQRSGAEKRLNSIELNPALLLTAQDNLALGASISFAF